MTDSVLLVFYKICFDCIGSLFGLVVMLKNKAFANQDAFQMVWLDDSRPSHSTVTLHL